MKVSKIEFNEDFFGFIFLICFCVFMGIQGYNNFQDHRNIFPRPDCKEYVYVCPQCKYVSKSTHKYCPECHKLIHYNQIKTELK